MPDLWLIPIPHSPRAEVSLSPVNSKAQASRLAVGASPPAVPENCVLLEVPSSFLGDPCRAAERFRDAFPPTVSEKMARIFVKQPPSLTKKERAEQASMQPFQIAAQVRYCSVLVEMFADEPTTAFNSHVDRDFPGVRLPCLGVRILLGLFHFGTYDIAGQDYSLPLVARQFLLSRSPANQSTTEHRSSIHARLRRFSPATMLYSSAQGRKISIFGLCIAPLMRGSRGASVADTAIVDRATLIPYPEMVLSPDVDLDTCGEWSLGF